DLVLPGRRRPELGVESRQHVARSAAEVCPVGHETERNQLRVRPDIARGGIRYHPRFQLFEPWQCSHNQWSGLGWARTGQVWHEAHGSYPPSNLEPGMYLSHHAMAASQGTGAARATIPWSRCRFISSVNLALY